MVNQRALLLEVAGLLNLIAEGAAVPNLRDQARELLEKVGAAVAGDDVDIVNVGALFSVSEVVVDLQAATVEIRLLCGHALQPIQIASHPIVSVTGTIPKVGDLVPCPVCSV